MFYDAGRLFDYLYIREEKYCDADLIIGFGHFDLSIPRQCAFLHKRGVADKILFTGGRGSGTAGLSDAEATVFRKVLLKEFPEIQDEDIILEAKSTNTGENISMSAEVLKAHDKVFNFDKGIKKVIAVASPYRQRRVWRTIQRKIPKLKVYNMPPDTTFEEELFLFKGKGQDLIKLLIGEIERILCYPEKGYMKYEQLPENIGRAYERLKKAYL